jgi:tetraacyldisaccharide 4'-kinase
VSDGSGRPLADWTQAGDEPALIARRLPGATVIVGRDRAAVWSRVAPALGPGVCLLDDGFQHLAIVRDENLLLLDATERYADAALLPKGRLREPLSALARASAVVVTRVDQAAPGAVDAIETLVRRVGPISRSCMPGSRSSAWSRSAQAARLRSIGSRASACWRWRGSAASSRSSRRWSGGASVADAVPFQDHHPYRRADLDRILERAHGARGLVVTTEKDAIKLESLVRAGESLWAAREARVEDAVQWNALIDRVAKVWCDEGDPATWRALVVRVPTGSGMPSWRRRR